MIDRGSMPRRMKTEWGSRHIDYLLYVETRRDLLIVVHPDLRVHVRAPAERPLEHILRRVHARRSWIARQLRQFERMTPLPPPRFVSGETLLYLGREFRLRIERPGRGVSLQAGRLVVHVSRTAGAQTVRNAVHEWYGTRAREVVAGRIERLKRDISSLSGLQPQVRVRRMTRRWGSCTALGTITINPALMQAPRACVDYVLVHELVHLLEPAHSPKFYRLFDRAMPDWRARRERLAQAAQRWE